jgi:hypothetical protein
MIRERMAAGLERLNKKWGGRRRPKAFYLGPDDWRDFLATEPPTGASLWNNKPALEPLFEGIPVRQSKNVLPRRSRLYDHTKTGHALPEEKEG